MRITYFTNKYPSISHTFIRREICELEQAGIQIHRLSLRCDSNVIDPEDHKELSRTTSLLKLPRIQILCAVIAHVFTRPILSIYGLIFSFQLAYRSGNRYIKTLAYYAEAILLKTQCKKHDSDLVRVHFGTNCATVARICRRIGGPQYSIAFHGPDEFDKPFSWDIGGTVHDSLFVTAITHYCSAQIKRWADVADWGKIHIIRCSVNPTFLNVAEMPYSSPRRVCMIGRFSAQKGLPILIRAFGQAIQEGANLHLDLVGDGELRLMIEDEINKLNIGNHVTLHGALSENGVAEVINTSCGLVMASFAEGLPVVLMEAMGLGRPVIATRIAGIPELVEHGINGWLVPADHVQSLCKTLHEFSNTPRSNLQSMGNSAHNTVRKMHNIFIESSKLLSLINKYMEH